MALDSKAGYRYNRDVTSALLWDGVAAERSVPMDRFAQRIQSLRIEKVMQALEKNNMKAFFVGRRSEVPEKVAALLPEGGTVCVGGSMTLFECGVMDLLRSGRYRFLDRYAPGLSREQIEDIYREAFRADAYLCSTNAVTEKGELYNVDGNSNRVAAMLYGPRSVIVVAGCQKIVRDIDEAVQRVKRIAAPANCLRLSIDTYCAAKGECVSCGGAAGSMAEGCRVANRPCCNYVVMAQQRVKDRVKVILVGEPAGY